MALWRLAAILFCLLWCGEAHAEDFCAVHLKVTSAAPYPITNTWIEVKDSSGNVEMRKQIKGSEADICDFGFGPHTLRVGTNECFPTSVENLRIVIGHPISLTVVLNACVGGQGYVINACPLYVRVSTLRGQATEMLTGVTASAPHLFALPLTDGYGRAQGLLGSSTHDEIVFTKPGYEPEKVSVECKNNENIERNVTLREIRDE